MIKAMREIAIAAHKGQVRRDGGDYFKDHVEQVSEMVEDRLKPIALGHDLIEDTKITLHDLIEAGFPSYVTDAIDVLTHKNNEPNVAYWTRIAQNKDAVAVKLADIRNNLSGTPSDRQKEKYAQALRLFAAHGYAV
jgi:(p)ppGpp synthase/HD superfamily hydrolase